MSRKRALFWLGLLIYAVSFALVAEAARWPGEEQTRGYMAAIQTFLEPLAENPISPVTDPWIFHGIEFFYVSLLISGLINPLFLVILVLAAMGYQQAFSILRIILLLMIPFCWVVINFQHYYPREGHFLWLLGMVLALFCFKGPIKRAMGVS